MCTFGENYVIFLNKNNQPVVVFNFISFYINKESFSILNGFGMLLSRYCIFFSVSMFVLAFCNPLYSTSVWIMDVN